MKKNKLIFIVPLLVSGVLFSCVHSSGEVSSSSDSSSQTPSTREPKTFYAAPNGDVEATGTENDPLELNKAFSNLIAGDTLILKNGTYKTLSRLLTSDNQTGTKDKPITVKAETNGKVLIDFTGMAFGSTNRGLQIASDYWIIDGLAIKGAGDNGIYIGGSHNIVRNCETFSCMDSGIQLGRANSSQQTIVEWPSYNLIENCTSHDNADPNGEDSDGFACKLTTGVGNVFKGCIAYNNIDDGWDLYTKADTKAIGWVTLEDCVAFNNGITSKGVGKDSSDGNGFKLGGENISVPHKVINCIAFNNLAHGFTDNSNPGPIWLENCTAFNNSVREADANNIDLCRDVAVTNGNYFKNVLSFSTGDHVKTGHWEKDAANSNDQYYGAASHCIFYSGLSMHYIEGPDHCDYTKEQYLGKTYKSEVSPFVSIEVPNTEKGEDEDVFNYNFLRDENHNINLGDFLKINPNSPFYTLGENNTPIGANLHK